MLESENGVCDVGMHDSRPLNYGNLTSITTVDCTKRGQLTSLVGFSITLDNLSFIAHEHG